MAPFLALFTNSIFNFLSLTLFTYFCSSLKLTCPRKRIISYTSIHSTGKSIYFTNIIIRIFIGQFLWGGWTSLYLCKSLGHGRDFCCVVIFGWCETSAGRVCMSFMGISAWTETWLISMAGFYTYDTILKPLGLSSTPFPPHLWWVELSWNSYLGKSSKISPFQRTPGFWFSCRETYCTLGGSCSYCQNQCITQGLILIFGESGNPRTCEQGPVLPLDHVASGPHEKECQAC